MLHVKHRRGTIALFFCAIVLGSAAGNTSAATVQAMIMNFAYDPPTLTINVNDTVIWQNHDNATHSVTFVNGMADSPALANGDSYSFTFTQPGTFTYGCRFHAGMQGSVIVRPAALQPRAWLPWAERP